jgi:hypothetical protein
MDQFKYNYLNTMFSKYNIKKKSYLKHDVSRFVSSSSPFQILSGSQYLTIKQTNNIKNNIKLSSLQSEYRIYIFQFIFVLNCVKWKRREYRSNLN